MTLRRDKSYEFGEICNQTLSAAIDQTVWYICGRMITLASGRHFWARECSATHLKISLDLALSDYYFFLSKSPQLQNIIWLRVLRLIIGENIQRKPWCDTPKNNEYASNNNSTWLSWILKVLFRVNKQLFSEITFKLPTDLNEDKSDRNLFQGISHTDSVNVVLLFLNKCWNLSVITFFGSSCVNAYVMKRLYGETWHCSKFIAKIF